MLENIWVREEEIIDIISILDNNKATGPDKISNKMIISIKKRNSHPAGTQRCFNVVFRLNFVMILNNVETMSNFHRLREYHTVGIAN